MDILPIYIFAKWQVKAGFTRQVLDLLDAAATESRKEKGNLHYNIQQSETDPDTIILF
ncbi:antibiotic biosynthesis monooxygenase family protein [Mucilaginibacter sp. JRF]|uniref:putative quinol monooxygenase n=1 Tax=Mucilaginibacter sp. JRF TaxID=2780088 RepID=UPI001D16B56F|nr:antibiotic biosynthesis monooxygenase family protein [Mucilaginibacter sp. JRF]